MIDFEKYRYLKPSPDYREMIILREIRKKSSITQKELAMICGIRASMINEYINSLESRGLLIKSGKTRRKMKYFLTEDGERILQVHILSFLNEASELLTESKELFQPALNYLKSNSLDHLILYGAGEVGRVVGKVLLNEGFKIVAFVDDDMKKIGRELLGIKIMGWNSLKDLNFDCCIIASYRNFDQMRRNAWKILGKDKVMYFSVSEDGKVSILK